MSLSNFKVSIIIPVYNAEFYLAYAVNSALQFSCVHEIILVEDASPDLALALCIELENKHPRVHLFTHPNHENKGPGASRNLGISKATASYIAFLDADDWFLPNRFIVETAVLDEHSKFDGVYGATGFYYENKKELDPERLTSFDKVIEPEDLLYEILRPNGGRFTTDAITIKKSVLDRIGYMNTSLRLHQDSELWNRIAFHAVLKTGIIKEAIAIRRVHNDNRIAHANKKTSQKYNRIVFHYFKDKTISAKTLKVILKNIIITEATTNSFISRSKAALIILIKNPSLIFKLMSSFKLKLYKNQ